MDNRSYNYYAFVSYSHGDKAIAKSLQRQLEAYRLPTAICKMHGDLPRKIKPVFRDETDLAGNRVQGSLDRELNDSRYLIVVCSPKSARSSYVNDEVASFVAQGREDHIIPYIIDGIPFSGGETECFPPALRDIRPEILGYDRKELGKRNSFLKIVATMLAIRPDELIGRDKKRRALVVGATLALIFSILMAFILLLLQWNADVTQQLEITERNESEVLALLSQESLESGDRYGAVENALKGLPNANRDRAYSEKAVYALSQALYLYQNPSYGFGSMVRHGVEIQSFAVSESGRYALVFDSQGYLSLYDAQNSKLLWTNPFDIYYAYPLRRMLVLEEENIVFVDRGEIWYCFDLATGADVSAEKLDGSGLEHAAMQMHEETKTIALHQYTREVVGTQANGLQDVEYRNWFVFCDANGNVRSKTEELPLPTSIDQLNAGSFTHDGGRYTASFWDRKENKLHILVLDTATGGILHRFMVPGWDLPGGIAIDDLLTEAPPRIFLDGSLIWYLSGDALVLLNPEEGEKNFASINGIWSIVDGGEVLFSETLPEAILAAKLRQDGVLEVVLQNGDILHYTHNAGVVEDESETVFSCGFRLRLAEYAWDELFVIKEDGNGNIIHLSDDPAVNLSPVDLSAPLEAGINYEIYPTPDGAGILAFGQKPDGEYHLVLYDEEAGAVSHAFTFSWESGRERTEVLSFAGFSTDPSKLILSHCLFDLETGTTVDFDLDGYDPDPVYGYEFNHSNFTGNRGVYSAVFNTEQDVLTWWRDGEARKTSKAPVDFVDNYFWMHPWNLTEVGQNGLILIRNYLGNAYLDVMKQDPEFNRDRPVAYGVFSVEDNAWKYFENPCTENGIPAHAMAQGQKWIAFADYDGFIRIYDWDTDAVICRIPMEIPGQSVSSMQFAMGDSVLLIAERTGALTLVDVESGAILGEFQLDDQTDPSLVISEDAERNLLYIGDAGGGMTGLCLETTTWTLLHEIPGLIGTLSHAEKILQRDPDDNRLRVTQVLSLSEMVTLGQEYMRK